MKRVSILVAVFLCLCSLCSCEKEEKGLSASDFVGIWAPTDDEDITCYWEFKSDGTVQYYELAIPYYDYDFEPAYYSDGVLYYPSLYGQWDLIKSGYYAIEDDQLFYMGKNAGKVVRVNNNMFILQSDMIIEGTIQKVNHLEKYDNVFTGINSLKGKWWDLVLCRYMFNDGIVHSEITDINDEDIEEYDISRFFFDDTSVTVEYVDEGRLESISLPYSFIQESRTIVIHDPEYEDTVFPIERLTEDKFEYRWLMVGENDGWTEFLDPNDLVDSFFYNFNSTPIYCRSGQKVIIPYSSPYWFNGVWSWYYYDQNGDSILCRPFDFYYYWGRNTDGTGRYIGAQGYDFFYDSLRYCMIAEKN